MFLFFVVYCILKAILKPEGNTETPKKHIRQPNRLMKNHFEYAAKSFQGVYLSSGFYCDVVNHFDVRNNINIDFTMFGCVTNNMKNNGRLITPNKYHGSYHLVLSPNGDSECGFSYDGFRKHHHKGHGTPCDGFWAGKSDPHVSQALYSVLHDGCRQNEYALDLGSNVGVFTLQIRSYGCRVVAVEPQEDLVNMTIASLKGNSWWYDGTVTLYHGGIGPSGDIIKVSGPPLWRLGGDTQGEARKSNMKIISIAKIMDGRHFRIIKLDIDGPEAHILSQLAERTSQFDSMIVEISWKRFVRLNVGLDFAQRQFERLYDAGFEAYLVYEKMFSQYEAVAPKVIQKLKRQSLLSINDCFKIPREMFRLVMDMDKKSTKNVFFIKSKLRKELESVKML